MRGYLLKILLIIIIDDQLDASVTNKCCENSITDFPNGSFSCSNHTGIAEIIRINTPFLGDNFTKCVDVFQNKVTIFGKNNNTFTKLEEIEVPTKCCPNFHLYNTTKRACDKTNLPNEFDKESIVRKIGLPQCEIITDELAEKLSEFGHRKSTGIFPDYSTRTPKTQFCLDRTVDGKYVKRACGNWSVCESLKCIRKCCEDGRSFVGGSQCRDTFVHGLELVHFRGFVGKTSGGIAVVHGKSPKVSLKRNISTFFLDEKGDFHNSQTDEIYFHPEQPYCIEHAEKPNVIKGFGYFGFLRKTPPIRRKFLWNRAAMIVSCCFLISTVFFYIAFGQAKNVFGKTLVSFCLSLLLLYLFLVYLAFSANLHFSSTRNLCKIFGFLVIYLGFSCFCWLQVMCYDINATFGKTSIHLDISEKQKRDLKKFLIYSSYGWGLPFLYTALLVTLHKTDILPNSIKINIGVTKCAIEKGNYSEILFRAIPLTIIQIVNTIYFARTVNYIMQVKKEIRAMVETPATLQKKKKFFVKRQRFGLIIKLSFTMGILYLFEVVSSFYDFNQHNVTAVVEIVWDFINCLQGVFIFLIFLCKKKHFDRLKSSRAVERIRKMSSVRTSWTNTATNTSTTNTTTK
ncbi:unnamed protein product [Phyllotreta striolata]|uniref:G-protein coupled receptors family 2 profile 2 domain-containing protein n=1 Tax=Phyllotreta striolata TaxID=444603 RepID=A0A9N9XPM8_PHYSR|nr:unnamed protein product [Phyllotreta striolata]